MKTALREPLAITNSTMLITIHFLKKNKKQKNAGVHFRMATHVPLLKKEAMFRGKKVI